MFNVTNGPGTSASYSTDEYPTVGSIIRSSQVAQLMGFTASTERTQGRLNGELVGADTRIPDNSTLELVPRANSKGL